jgi:hypothetical protein
MFERYAQNIDPESEHFITFISRYLTERKVNNPRAISYQELYMLIKQGIRDYLLQVEPDRRETESLHKPQ